MKTEQKIILFLAKNFNREFTINEISKEVTCFGRKRAYLVFNQTSNPIPPRI